MLELLTTIVSILWYFVIGVIGIIITIILTSFAWGIFKRLFLKTYAKPTMTEWPNDTDRNKKAH